MGRKRSRLTEQRLVPFEASRDVAYPYDRPRALHRSPTAAQFCQTDPDTCRTGGLSEVLSAGLTSRCVYSLPVYARTCRIVLSGEAGPFKLVDRRLLGD